MTDPHSTRALVVNPKSDIINRLDALTASDGQWRRLDDVPRPALSNGAYLVVTPDDSGLATTCALAWAVSLKQRTEKSALIVDYAWEQDGLTQMLEADREVGVRDIIDGAMMAEDRVISGQYCDFLPVGRKLKSTPSKGEIEKFRNLLELLKTTYDNVIVLVENPLRNGESIQIAKTADGVVIAVALNQTERDCLEALKRRLDQSDVSTDGVLVLRDGDVSPTLSDVASRLRG